MSRRYPIQEEKTFALLDKGNIWNNAYFRGEKHFHEYCTIRLKHVCNGIK